MCLPKDECSAFRIATTNPDYGMLDYSLTVDGTVHRDATWYIGNTSSSTFSMNQTTYIGDCVTEDICGNDESLLSVEFAVKNNHPGFVSDAGWSLLNIPTLTWTFDSSFIVLPLGTRYKTQLCLPVSDDGPTGDEGCQYELGFGGRNDPFPLENIRVKRDGAQQPLRESYAIGAEKWFYLPKWWAGFGTACYSGATGFSSGAMMGTVVGALVSIAFGVV